ncbi:MAG TPA: SUF system Fe-S cluster assembly regulator [Rhodospirillaceae bacterium]|nr:SUF system Fe-S cluster assembly regulator [Rhodospirillaceae bacterium]
MLRVSKLAGYAFVILAKMALDGEKNWPASLLSQETTLPLPTVAKLMKILAHGGLVVAQRGVQGGYRLASPAPEISIANIVEAVDGPIRLTECAGIATGKEKCNCAVQNKCPVCESWGHINTAVKDSLNAVHLSDITHHEKEQQVS